MMRRMKRGVERKDIGLGEGGGEGGVKTILSRKTRNTIQTRTIDNYNRQ